jgi:hypothetical protein
MVDVACKVLARELGMERGGHECGGEKRRCGVGEAIVHLWFATHRIVGV